MCSPVECQLRSLTNYFSDLLHDRLNEMLCLRAQSCLTLCDPMDCSLPGSSIHGIFQALVLEWVAFSFSRGSSWPRDQTQVSHIESNSFPSLFYGPVYDGNLISGSSVCSKSNLNIWKFSVHVLLKPSLENFEHYFAVRWVQLCSSLSILRHYLYFLF